VRLTGLEPALREQLDPKSSASTNSATSADLSAKLMKKIESKQEKGRKDEVITIRWRSINLFL
jgi:hypothetical protein